MLIKLIIIMAILISSSVLFLTLSNNVSASSDNANLFPSNINKPLSVRWWQWILSIPADNNPIRDESGQKCGVKQSGQFWFLVGVEPPSVSSADRNCTIPKGKGIFFPIFNVLVTLDKNDPDLNTVDKIKNTATDLANLMTDLGASVDGVNVQNINQLRAQSPVFRYTVPGDNIFEPPVAPGTYTAVSDGFYVPLKPLSVGQHTIHFEGSVPDFDLHVDVTYHITVK